MKSALMCSMEIEVRKLHQYRLVLLFHELELMWLASVRN